MGTEKEKQQLVQIIDRLTLRFPETDPASVADVVARAAAQFDDATVRDYVPILVENSARNLIRQRLLGNPAAA